MRTLNLRCLGSAPADEILNRSSLDPAMWASNLDASVKPFGGHRPQLFSPQDSLSSDGYQVFHDMFVFGRAAGKNLPV